MQAALHQGLTRHGAAASIVTFFALLLVTRHTYNVGPIFLLLASASLWLSGRRTPLPPLAWPLLMAFSGYVLAIGLSMVATGERLSTLDNPSRLLLLLVVLWGLWCWPFRLEAVWLGASLGAFGGLGIALYQRFILEMPRAEGFQHPIMFGDVAMLLGLLALVGLAHALHTRRLRRMLVLYLAASLAGLVTSLLSGTRGGWIGLPVILFALYRYYAPILPRRLWLGSLIGFALVGFMTYTIPATGVADRIHQAIHEVKTFHQDTGAESSVGARLELWRAGAKLVREAGLLGLSEAQVHDRLRALVDEGTVRPPVLEQPHFHNEILQHWIRHGLLGLLALLALYFLPLRTCMRLVTIHAPELKAAAMAGVVTLTAIIDFGLTQTFLLHQIGMMAFGFTVTVLWVAMLQAPATNEGASLNVRSDLEQPYLPEALHRQPPTACSPCARDPDPRQ
ncbi:MAG: O-antigen ligase family protein [Gammaproteobacteria bacterium]|nr:O-antigen ligase family protein [Gammaproteobacteria bacterium]